MVTLPTNKNDGRRSRKPHKMETKVRWHNRGNAWDKITTVWVDKENLDGSKKKDKYVGG